MNLQPTVKYDLPPNESENKLIESEEYKLQYDFRRLKKIDKTSARYSRYDQKKDKNNKKKLCSPLEKGEIVLVLSSRLKKKDYKRKTLLSYFIKARQNKKVSLTKIVDSL